MLSWWEYGLLGMLGGILIEVLGIFHCASNWQRARLKSDGTVRTDRAAIGRFIDFPAHCLMLPARALLGGAMAYVFGATGQVDGAYAAVALGCTAPLLLAQLGANAQVRAAVAGASQAESATGTLDQVVPENTASVTPREPEGAAP